MTFYAAAITTCIAAAVWAWAKATPSRGRGSIAYLSPFTNIFLGMAFIVSGATNVPRPWLRITYILAGLFQFWPAWSIWNRRRQLREIRLPQ